MPRRKPIIKIPFKRYERSFETNEEQPAEDEQPVVIRDITVNPSTLNPGVGNDPGSADNIKARLRSTWRESTNKSQFDKK